ncbi:MAG: DNA repair protein RecO [Nitrospinae bacterium]|nr:DNA repair protein RecO [Nitrospinota bacterium]
MPLYTSESIILKTSDFSENKRIVIFFTEKKGKVPVVVRKSKSKKFNFAAIEPTTLCRVTYFGKENVQLFRFSNSEIINYYLPLKSSLTLLNYSSCFSEIILYLVRDFDPNKYIFETYKNFLKSLIEFKDESNTINLIFFISLIQVYKSIGIYSEINDLCHMCKIKIDGNKKVFIVERGVVCNECIKKGNYYNKSEVSASSIMFLKTLGNSKFHVSTKLNINPQSRREIFDYLISVYKNYTNREINSLKVFREIIR